MRFGRHEVPDLWEAMLPDDFQWLKAPEESSSTCQDCRMVRRQEYHPDTQCCTYYPEIPNFLLGLALGDPASASAVEGLLATGHGLPTGLVPPPHIYKRSVVEYSKERFGKEAAMRCPLMDAATRNCNVYLYRNSVCSTFFCTNDHGAAGEEFWGRVQDLVGHVEVGLAQWAMNELAVCPAEYVARVDRWSDRHGDLDGAEGGWSEAARRDLWGEWFGREGEFYRRCAELVKENRDRLFDLATRQSVSQPLGLERAMLAAVPEEAKRSAPRIPESTGHKLAIEDLWYKLQLSARNLWALPFGEGKLIWADGLRIEAVERPLALHDDAPYRARLGEEERELSALERDALELFREPRMLDEKLLESPVIQALSDPRATLAQWMRLGLVTRV